jgi:F0F1-type ATP synthase assembly protein I
MAGPSKTSRYLRLSSVGLELGAAVIIGLWGGQWLDTKLGTTPWLMLLGLAFGMTAGFRSIFRLLKDANRPPEDDDTKKS